MVLKTSDSVCQHNTYCPLEKSVCRTTDFKELCLLRESPIHELPMLSVVKEQVERKKSKE